MSFDTIYDILIERFETYNFDEGHRLDHSLRVASHAYLALRDFDYLNNDQRDAVILACILHDVNDHKFITRIEDKLDLYSLLSDIVSVEVIDLTILMIDYVSCSKNGDSRVDPIWLLIPRYSDRLEAMGEVGLRRAITYANHIGRPFITRTTERVYNDEDLKRVASKDRYELYISGKRVSPSTMDHIYDKIIHLDIPEWFTSPTLKFMASYRRTWLKTYILNYFNKIHDHAS